MKVWMGAHSGGEHAGAVGFTGELAVGEFHGCRAVVSLRPLFPLADTWVPRASRRAEGGSQAWAALCRGPSDLFGPAQHCLSDWISLLFFIIEIKNGLKNVWVIKLVPNLLKQILLGSLSSDPLGKIIACHF